MKECEPSFKEFAVNEMKENGTNVRRWAAQNENPLLKSLALETIEAARE